METAVVREIDEYVAAAERQARLRGGNTAISCLKAGRRLSSPQVGALAVMAHHVGIVKEVSGDSVTLVSGNHSGRSGTRQVGVGKYARSRVVVYVWPD